MLSNLVYGAPYHPRAKEVKVVATTSMGLQARSRADASVAVSAGPRALWTRAHASRARGDSGFLFSALVAFGVRGKILTLAAKPTVPEWAGEANAVRMEGLVAIVA